MKISPIDLHYIKDVRATRLTSLPGHQCVTLTATDQNGETQDFRFFFGRFGDVDDTKHRKAAMEFFEKLGGLPHEIIGES